MYVITLSTIPPRFDKIGPTLQSLLRQTATPDRIIVYIPEHYTRFPDWDGTLPQDLPEGVEIRRCTEDFGPATKLLPALREFDAEDIDILFCDDDCIYPPGWAARFLKGRVRRPGDCLTLTGDEVSGEVEATMERALQPRALRLWRKADPFFQSRRLYKYVVERLTGRVLPRATRRPNLRSGYVDVLGGSGGVLVKPSFFDEEVFDIPPELRAVDDYWLSGNLAKNGIGIWLDAGHARNIASEAETADALSRSVIGGDDRSQANARCVRYMRERYGIWP